MPNNKKKLKKEKTPLVIRNELRILCALKGCSNVKGGESRIMKKQWDFYHSKEPSRPTQTKLLREGTYCHADLREMQ